MLENEMQFRMDLEKLKAQVAEYERRLEDQEEVGDPPLAVEAGSGIEVQAVAGAWRVSTTGEPEALLPFDVRVNQADGAPGVVEFWLPADSMGAVVMRNGQRVVAESTKSYVYGAWNSVGTLTDEPPYAVVLEIVEESTYTQGSSEVTKWPVGHISATAWQIVPVKLSDIQSRYGSVAKTQMIIALVNASNNGITGAWNVVQLMRGAVHTSFVSVDSDDELLFGRTGEAYWRSLSGIDGGGQTAGQWKTRELRNFKKGTAPNFAPDSGEGTFAFVVRTQTTAGGTEVFYYDWSTFLTKLASKLKVTVGGTDYDVKVK